MNEEKTVAQELTELRKTAGVSTTEAAASIGKTAATIANWEAGKCEPTVSLYNRLKRYYQLQAECA